MQLDLDPQETEFIKKLIPALIEQMLDYCQEFNIDVSFRRGGHFPVRMAWVLILSSQMKIHPKIFVFENKTIGEGLKMITVDEAAKTMIKQYLAQ